MPFTPFHMGPALAIKVVAGERFSLLAFGLAQVIMDIEPLVGIIRHSEVLHGPTHTYLAAVPIGLAAAAITPALGRRILHRWNRELAAHRLGWLASPEDLAPGPVLTGALVGSFSHVAIDSLTHADMHPFAPWSAANGLLGLMTLGGVELACAAVGLTALAGWVAAAWRRRP